MTTAGWLPLAEYSIKHQVSISTLRRRIKADDIKFRFQDGKYFLYDQTMRQASQHDLKQEAIKSAPPAMAHRPSLRSEIQSVVSNTVASSPMMTGSLLATSSAPAPVKMEATARTEAPAGATSGLEPGESVISAANKLLTDLKKAYTQVLQEKEEQILQLREEVVDLKTLIKVLESENSRLRDLR
ncbi:hypothetical protein [Pseudobdellovibrio exovorus]|uniref:Uncharacterized protein n=1 Tax=Pseudobdellovibrio exovorus JSS TaxID=1184267 RepID=M4VFG7_9BACT|nr:hypothetical protein [Pseudobdellovibrio exovorus]AGH96796.1 hypothetical protein A11Q_2580 [Pseudobdellovibrio exovorus JSS]